MPRTNIPYRSLQKRINTYSRILRSSDSRSIDTQQGPSCPVNNILVFPKNSETTINVLADNSQIVPYGNLLKKIKGRKRKEKQRLKRKQNLEGDVKPIISNAKASKSENMRPKVNKHIIFLSDSDNENSEIHNRENSKESSIPSDTIERTDDLKNDDDDDVIFVETPPAEIIEIDDSTETSEKISDSSSMLEKLSNEANSPDANDFLDNTHINLKSNFNFELHGSEFKGAEFLKPSTLPKDMSESGSVSSISDVSATIGTNVFNVVDFPQEKVNLFDDSNLEKFRHAITPQRPNKKSKNVSNDQEFDNSEHRENRNDNLPTLSDIQIEDNSRKQRGRSIIKELVNDRAYVLLSNAQKKIKNKKRKSKDGLPDTLEEIGQNDYQESNKRKKKKKSKKKDTPPNEIEHESCDIADDGKNKKRKERKQENEGETTKCPISIRTDLFEPDDSEIPCNIKKSRKNKRVESDEPTDEEDGEKRRMKIRKSEQEEDVPEDNEEKKKKKSKKTIELSADQLYVEVRSIQENIEEKKKKKVKKIPDISAEIISEKIQIDEHHSQVSEENDERKKKKCRRISELSSEIIVEKKKSDCINIDIQENNEEKRKKRNRKITTDIAENTLQDNTIILEEAQEEKRKSKKVAGVSTQIELSGNEKVTPTVALRDENKSGVVKIQSFLDESTVTSNEAIGNQTAKRQEQGKDEKSFPTSTTIDCKIHETKCEDHSIVQDDSETRKNENISINIQNISSAEKQKKDSGDVPKQREEKTKLDSYRTSEVLGDVPKKQKLEEHTMETVIVDDNVSHSRTGIQEVSTETKNANINEKGLTEDIQMITKGEMSGNTEKLCELVASSSDSAKKRKKETSVSENIDGLLESIESKRIKVEHEVTQPRIESNIQNEKVSLENMKESEKGHIIEVSSKDSENITAPSEERGSIDEHIDQVHRSIGNTGVSESLEGHRIIEKVENCNEGIGENSEMNPMLGVGDEENVVMKITNVFSLGNKSIFPEECNFVDDVDLNNFADKNNSSWNADPSRFHSYNGPLFIDDKIKTSENGNVVPNIEPVPTLTAASSDMLDSQANQNSELEPTILSSNTHDNFNETINVKKENLATTSSEITADKNLQEDVIVKVETENIANRTVEVTESQHPSSEKDNFPSDTSTSTSKTDMPSKSLNQELPNEIEEIVKEKDNLDTVKRLCEFLEEASDPSDVLKKVSLLKQAFKDQTQNSVRSNEEVQITYDNDDVFSISSGSSSIVCLEDDVSIVSIEDDITLANCDLAEGEKDKNAQNETFSSLVETNCDSNEVIHSEVEKNDEFENLASTSRSMFNSTLTLTETAQYKKGLDKYEVEDIQGYMSSDPKLWRIVSEDICPVRLPTKGKRCIKCREIGHLGYNCPNKLNLPKCSLCGMEGHLDFRCPNKLCTQCGRKTPAMQNFCEHCKHYRNITCVLCKNKGHPRNKCPDLWRRYHLTTNHGPLVQRQTLELKSKEKLWCSACATPGHLEFQCETSKTWRLVRNFQTLDPRIHHYVDVYKAKADANTVDSASPNPDKGPHTSRTFEKNDNQSGTGSLITPNNDNTDYNSGVSLNEATEKDHLIQNTEQRLQGSTPESIVTDKENKDAELNVGDENYQNFFMTASISALKHFLHDEICVLESTKFNIKDLIPRFCAFQQDIKLPADKSKFGSHRTEKFYKQLNMLLFGKLQFKNGKVYMDKLKSFLKRSPTSISFNIRESLWLYYDTIFRTKPHAHANYMFFLKILKEKYGNQKWLH